MMGVGKSTVGKNLAKKLSYNFIDIDKIVEFEENLSVYNIFRDKGENYFRKIEKKVTLRELKNNSSVISLGGGAFLNKSIRKLVKTSAISFWLDVNIEKLILRLKMSKKRPLLIKKNISQTIRKIYLERKKTYNEADHRIVCNNLKKNEVVEKIYNLYENTRN
tara:strand:- start:319 stop:807 length:489 start_codon:yes stop_codon:yes gene_type:complete